MWDVSLVDDLHYSNIHMFQNWGVEEGELKDRERVSFVSSVESPRTFGRTLRCGRVGLTCGKKVGPGEGTTPLYGERGEPADRRDVCWMAREAPTSIVSLRGGNGGPLGGLVGEGTPKDSEYRWWSGSRRSASETRALGDTCDTAT